MHFLQIISQQNMSLNVFIAVIVWSVFLKGLALWISARNKQLGWFVMLITVQTAGILEIIYLVRFRQNKPRKFFTKSHDFSARLMLDHRTSDFQNFPLKDINVRKMYF